MILPLFQLRLCRRMGCAAREPRAGSVLRPCGGGRSPFGDERDDADDGQNREGRCSIGGERRGIECRLGSGLGSPGPPCGSMSPSPNQKSPPLFLCRVFLPVSRLNLSARRRARRDGHHRLRRAHLRRHGRGWHGSAALCRGCGCDRRADHRRRRGPVAQHDGGPHRGRDRAHRDPGLLRHPHAL